MGGKVTAEEYKWLMANVNHYKKRRDTQRRLRRNAYAQQRFEGQGVERPRLCEDCLQRLRDAVKR